MIPDTAARAENEHADDVLSSEVANPTAIVFDAAQFDRLRSQSSLGATKVLALSPPARASALSEASVELLGEPLSTMAHARIVARSERATRRFLAALDRKDLNKGTLSTIRYLFQVRCYLGVRLWEILRGGGPWLIEGPNGWTDVDGREVAHELLLQSFDRQQSTSRRPPLAPLYRLLRGMALRQARVSGHWIATRRRDLVFGLTEAIAKQRSGFRRMIVSITGRGVGDYLDLFELATAGLTGRSTGRVLLLAEPRNTVRATVERALAAVDDPVIERVFTGPWGDDLLAQAAECEGLLVDAERLMRSLAPTCYLTRQESGQFAVVAEAAGRASVARYVINYNSLPPSDSAIASRVLGFVLGARMPEGLSDNIMLWSPNVARLGKQVYSVQAAKSLRPLRIAPPPIESVTRRTGPARLLHASNFSEWGFFLPFVMETSNEFLADVLSLAEELREMECDVDLTVRTKTKGECGPDTLRRLLARNARCTVTGVERPFAEALRDADLVIGFMSTTLEEALLNRKPVLLWGPTRRYLHLPARAVPPTSSDRSAVYVAHDQHHLRAMLPAILDAHLDRPLTDAEIAEHVWPEGTTTVDDLAQEIVSLAAGHHVASRRGVAA